MISLVQISYLLLLTSISLRGTSVGESLSRAPVKKSDLEDTIKGQDEHEKIRVIRGMQKMREDILKQIRDFSDEVSEMDAAVGQIATHNQTLQGFLRNELSERQMSSKRHHKPTRHYFFGDLTAQNYTNGWRHRLHIEAFLESRQLAQWSTGIRDVTLYLLVNEEQLRHHPHMFLTSSSGTPRKSNMASLAMLPPQARLNDNTTTWLSFRLSRIDLLRQMKKPIKNGTHGSANTRVEFIVECFNCTSEYSLPVTAQSPVLMVTTVPGKSHISQRRRRGADCSPQGCCLKTIDATVEDLGLKTTIMTPEKFKMSYCAGSCSPEPIQKSLSGPILKMLRISLRQTGLWQPCCSPSQTRSVPLDVTFYVKHGNRLHFRSSKLWMEETMKCGCN